MLGSACRTYIDPGEHCLFEGRYPGEGEGTASLKVGTGGGALPFEGRYPGEGEGTASLKEGTGGGGGTAF